MQSKRSIELPAWAVVVAVASNVADVQLFRPAKHAPDYEEIVQFIENGYINAFHEADFPRMRRLFHQDSWYFFTTSDGTLYKGAFDDEEVRGWAGSEQDWEHTILSVTQAGDVASVMLEMRSKTDPSSAWVDIHALLRIDGEWHDMNKTATHASRADWAGHTDAPSI